MTERQKKASNRNWLKARLLVLPSLLHKDLLTEEECIIAENILKEYNILMANWDNQSKIFSVTKNKQDDRKR